MTSNPRDFLRGFIDIISMTARPFLGFNYILRIVDPVRRFGFTVVLRSNAANDLMCGFEKLVLIMRVEPQIIYYADHTSFVSDFITHHSTIQFKSEIYSPLMKKERLLYKKQLQKWCEAYNNNWVRGVVIVQAIVNAMPLEANVVERSL